MFDFNSNHHSVNLKKSLESSLWFIGLYIYIYVYTLHKSKIAKEIDGIPLEIHQFVSTLIKW